MKSMSGWIRINRCLQDSNPGVSRGRTPNPVISWPSWSCFYLTLQYSETTLRKEETAVTCIASHRVTA